ncbi:MAG: hypothetical protein FWF52_06205 [Candidatus Azobacteroides sp.]|nr:hypothetical protein [Candidatus Azobacteroides sp.]
MKKYFLLLAVLLLSAACGNDKKAAQSCLEEARNLYENAQYGSAKQVLDQLKGKYPKEFEVQRNALHLKHAIEIKEQERNLVYSDSLMQVRRAQADSMKSHFVFVKDPQYDRIGRYIDKAYNPPVDAGGNHIAINVNENGEIALSSVYRGASAIKHNQLKVTAPSGESAETEAISFDGGANYSFQDSAGTIYEIVTYQKGRDKDVLSFIYNCANNQLTMELVGKKKIRQILSVKEKQAVVKTVDLAVILTDIERLEKEKEKAEKRLEYLYSKEQN